MGAIKAMAEGIIRKDQVVICLVTGSAFNDEEAFARMTEGNLPRRLSVEALSEHL